MEESVQVKSNLMNLLPRLMLTVFFCTPVVPISHISCFRTCRPRGGRHLVLFGLHASTLPCCVHLVLDIDECLFENKCHVNATCTNTRGSYSCTCKKGYGGDGKNCSGNSSLMKVLSRVILTVLFCTPCVPMSHVIFWHSSTSWSLPCWFIWSAASSKLLCCVHLVPDIDECSSANECNMNAICMNTIGSYNCTCKKGYQGDGRNCSGKVHCKEGIMDL